MHPVMHTICKQMYKSLLLIIELVVTIKRGNFIKLPYWCENLYQFRPFLIRICVVSSVLLLFECIYIYWSKVATTALSAQQVQINQASGANRERVAAAYLDTSFRKVMKGSREGSETRKEGVMEPRRQKHVDVCGDGSIGMTTGLVGDMKIKPGETSSVRRNWLEVVMSSACGSHSRDGALFGLSACNNNILKMDKKWFAARTNDFSSKKNYEHDIRNAENSDYIGKFNSNSFLNKSSLTMFEVRNCQVAMNIGSGQWYCLRMGLK